MEHKTKLRKPSFFRGKVVKATALLWSILFLGFYSGYSQTKEVMIDKNQVITVDEVFDIIKKQTDYRFIYKSDIFKNLSSVKVSKGTITVKKLLSQSLPETGFKFSIKDKTIEIDKVIPVAEKKDIQEDVSISGNVTSAIDGLGIPGVNVIVKGNTSLGVATDMDGNFHLSAPTDAILIFSAIGMKTIELPASQVSNVVMTEDTSLLDEVVVVGYGTQKKESLTGALQTVSENKLKDITTPSVENMLNGKAPGVYVAPGSGKPGSGGKIIIRGKSTINGSTDPLWVIDGVIVGSGAGALNPADVETMTILKDAASTAIYGSQGANGVILVTTKKGKAGKITVSGSAKIGVTKINSGNLKVMNGAELYDYYSSFANIEQVKFPRWKPELRNSNFSWWDLASQTGFAQDYNISVSGGNENLKSMLSIGYYNEEGAIKGYDYSRYNFRFNTEYKPFEWLRVKPSLSGSMRGVDDRQYSVGAMYSNLPWDSPYDEKGNIVGHKSPLWVNSNSTNYLYDLQWNFGESTSYEFMGNFDFDIKITDYLTFSSINNFRLQDYKGKSYSDPRSSSASGVKGRLGQNQFEISRRYTNQILRFNKMYDKHSINALLAYEFNDYEYKNLNVSGTGFVPGFEVLDVVAVPEATKGNITEWAVQSYLFNTNYAYDNRYLAQFSLRRDEASNFGKNAKYGTFFSISGGWNVHNEAFFDVDWVNSLKLRASYGSVGNRPSALYPQYDLYSVSESYNEESGALISQIGNADLTWEKSYTSGIGLDATLFDRVYLTFDYYVKNTSDLLYRVPVSALTGVTSIWRNVGEVKNKGFEISLGVDVLKTEDLLWTIEGNLGLNRNEVIELYGKRENGKVPPIIIGDGSGIAGSADKILEEGFDADTWYLREWAGVNPENGSPQWYKTVVDGNGNKTRVKTSKYAEADAVKMGAYTPSFFGGFSTSLQWKQLDFNANFGYSVGGKIYNYSRQEYDSDGAYSDRNQMKLMDGWSRWEKKGDIATHPKPSYNNSTNSQKVSSRYLEDGDYLKLRSLTLGYNLALPQYNISNLRFFVTGENLLTITDYSGVDPEIPPSGSNQITGVTTTVYPSTRKFILGINVTF